MLSMSLLVSGGRLVRKRMLLGGCWSSWATSGEGEGEKGKEEEELRAHMQQKGQLNNCILYHPRSSGNVHLRHTSSLQ